MNPAPISFCMTICSRRRPALLKAALTSVVALEIPENVTFSILVAENDDTPIYADIIAGFAGQIEVHHISEPLPGLTHVRNLALTTAEDMGFDWIGSIDDDVTIPPDWLIQMIANVRKYPDTQMFYGNWVRKKHADEPAWHPEPYQLNKQPTGRVISVASFNNIAVSARVFRADAMGLRFDHSFRFTGGEDTDFTRSYLRKGGTVRSVREAWATEIIPEKRAAFSDRLNRAAFTEYTLAKIRHKHQPKLVAALWSLQTVYRGTVLGVANLILGFLALPFNELWGLKRYGKGRHLLASVRGVLRYYFGSEPEPYREDTSE